VLGPRARDKTHRAAAAVRARHPLSGARRARKAPRALARARLARRARPARALRAVAAAVDRAVRAPRGMARVPHAPRPLQLRVPRRELEPSALPVARRA